MGNKMIEVIDDAFNTLHNGLQDSKKELELHAEVLSLSMRGALIVACRMETASNQLVAVIADTPDEGKPTEKLFGFRAAKFQAERIEKTKQALMKANDAMIEACNEMSREPTEAEGKWLMCEDKLPQAEKEN